MQIRIEPLTAEVFAPFGEVIEARGAPDMVINQGLCGRHHDLAKLEFADGDEVGEEGRAAINVFVSAPRSLPYKLEMMERHPLGSQAFLPLSEDPFLVIVAPDDGGKPGLPRAFLTKAGQGVNYRRNLWHGVLTPLGRRGQFAVVDRVGGGNNLQEHWFEAAYVVVDENDLGTTV